MACIYKSSSSEERQMWGTGCLVSQPYLCHKPRDKRETLSQTKNQSEWLHTHAQVITHTHIYLHTQAHMHLHTCEHPLTHEYVCTHMCRHTYALEHAYTITSTDIHIYPPTHVLHKLKSLVS